MNDLEQKNLLQTENKTSDELNAEELEAVSGGISWLGPVLPDIIGVVGALFGGGSDGGSNRSKSTSRSNSEVVNSGNSHVTVNCG